jgi:hypothetical protein
VRTVGVSCGRLLITALAVLSLAACGSTASEAHLGASTASPATISTTAATPTSPSEPIFPSTSIVTPPTTTVDPPPVDVGDTQSLSAEPVLGPGNPALDVTLNQVIDPAPIQDPRHAPPQGERDVEMKVTIANVGSVLLPAQGGRHVLTFTWYLNPSDSVPGHGIEFEQNLPSVTCRGIPQDFTQDVAPGQSITGCVQFGPIPYSIVVTGFEAALSYGGFGDTYSRVWRIS